jgi:hypothetical protein
MKLYTKIKKAFDSYHYHYGGNRCKGCPSALFMNYYWHRTDVEHLIGCGGLWEDYADNNCESDWYDEHNLDDCDNCRSMAVALSKGINDRSVIKI